VRRVSADRCGDQTGGKNDAGGEAMSGKADFEPERYELREAPLYHFDLDRRQFFKVFGSGLVVLQLVEAALAKETG
jgi:hypothetical protein